MCIYWFCHDAAQVKTAKNAAIVIIFTYNQLCNDDEWITTFRLKVTQNVLNLYFISIAFVPVNIIQSDLHVSLLTGELLV